MQSFIDAYNKTKILHHACLFEGDSSIVVPHITKFFEHDVGMYTNGNPDFHVREYDSFGIADSREIKKMAAFKSIAGDKKVFLLSFKTMTVEAQNALLKVLEEPTEGTHFMLVTGASETLLPTLKSRVMVVSANNKDGMSDEERNGLTKDLKKEAMSFLEATKSERLVMLKDYIEKKDKANIARFLNALEFVIYEKGEYHKNPKIVSALSYIEKNKEYVYDRSASLKMLLEHVALTVPQLKFK